MSIESNLAHLRERIAAAAKRSGRKAEDITLVAVSKYSGIDDVLEAARYGQRVFAENRVQMLREKWDALQAMPPESVPEITWHMIGQLQTNKVKYIVGRVALIHSVDSLHLAEEIARQSEKKGITSDILLEVNISGEESKSGIAHEEIGAFMEHFTDLSHIRLRGLMTMAPKGAPEPQLHKIFSGLREIFLDKQWENMHNIEMTYLSMGMSADFECAIEEGANMIRVGHGIFL